MFVKGEQNLGGGTRFPRSCQKCYGLPKPDKDGNYCPPGTCHYNVKFKTGALLHRVSSRDICGLRREDIEWIWIVEERRSASPEEIRELCKRATKR